MIMNRSVNFILRRITHRILHLEESYPPLMCLYTFSFSLSWGPLKWVVPSEIYPVEIRSAGQATTLSIALTFSFAQTQVFITLLCVMKYAIFLFYAGWVLAMTVFIALFLPETKGIGSGGGSSSRATTRRFSLTVCDVSS
jgi:hypothetical protein